MKKKYAKNVLIEQQQLARVYIKLKQYKLAKKIYDDSIKYTKKKQDIIIKQERFIIGDILSDFASFWYIQNETNEAKDSCKLAIEFYKQQINDNDNEAIYKINISIKKLGDIYRQQQKYEDAVDSYTIALTSLEEISKNNLAKYIKDILIIKNILANLFIVRDRVKEAIAMLSNSLKMQQLIYNINKGIRAVDIAKTLSLLNKGYMKTGEFQKAEIIAKQYIKYSKQMVTDSPKEFLPLLAEAKNSTSKSSTTTKKI